MTCESKQSILEWIEVKLAEIWLSADKSCIRRCRGCCADGDLELHVPVDRPVERRRPHQPNFPLNQTSKPPYNPFEGWRSPMRKLWRTLFILDVLAGASAGVYAWTRSGKKDDGFKQVEVIQGSIVEKAVAVGQIQPRQKFAVKSKISGIVKRALCQAGDTVQAGDPLFEIAPDPTPMEVTQVDRQVESGSASYRKAEGDYQRSLQLSRSGVLPMSDVEAKKESY